MEFKKNAIPNVNSKIRILHALPKGPNVDIYANGLLIARDIAFSKISNYFSLAAGNYEIQLYKTGFYDNPLYSQTVNLTGAKSYTLSLVSLTGNFYILLLEDDNIATTIAPSFLRFINLSPNSPLLTLSLSNGTTLFDSVEYLETTDYYKLSSGIYNFEVTIASDQAISKFIRNLTLQNGKFYTIYIIGLFNSEPKLGYISVEDTD